MQKQSSKTPKDPNQLAAYIVRLSTEEESETPTEKPKNEAAVALGRLGGLKGGQERAKKMTPERRKEIAAKAAKARWAKKKELEM